MVGWFGKAATVAASVCLLATVASAAGKEVKKCEDRTDKTLSKFLGIKDKCFAKEGNAGSSDKCNDARGNDCIVLASGEANCSCDRDHAAGRRCP